MTGAGQTNSSSPTVSPKTFDTVANIISEICYIPRETIKPESHAINDLAIDSLDFLDIVFGIDKAFGIKMPIEQWGRKSMTAWRQQMNISGSIISAPA